MEENKDSNAITEDGPREEFENDSSQVAVVDGSEQREASEWTDTGVYPKVTMMGRTNRTSGNSNKLDNNGKRSTQDLSELLNPYPDRNLHVESGLGLNTNEHTSVLRQKRMTNEINVDLVYSCDEELWLENDKDRIGDEADGNRYQEKSQISEAKPQHDSMHKSSTDYGDGENGYRYREERREGSWSKPRYDERQ